MTKDAEFTAGACVIDGCADSVAASQVQSVKPHVLALFPYHVVESTTAAHWFGRGACIGFSRVITQVSDLGIVDLGEVATDLPEVVMFEV